MNLEGSYERLWREFCAVKRDNDRMREDNNRLRIQVSAYIDTDSGQKREVDRLNEEAASLASQLAAQVAANATLRAEYEKLRADAGPGYRD